MRITEVSHRSVLSTLWSAIKRNLYESKLEGFCLFAFFFFFFLNYSWFIIVLFILRLNYKPKLHHWISAPRTLLPADLMAFCPWASAATPGPRDMEYSTLTGKPRGLGTGLGEVPRISLALLEAKPSAEEAGVRPP